MNYTKWEVIKDDWEFIITDRAGHTICSMPKLKELEANTHLIVAAPDMKAVLRQFVRYCEQWQQNNGEFPNGDGRVLILKNAEQALAKTKIKEDQ